ncbi:hypothetical protein NECAME_04233 [Necator americanus]|uniref:Uncharacterized protein n=1 Tax=Necator americanus TaxID=51031 RepID=W2SY99_NECAM|nr:hypothetical protein NECAME_04233 [Necator americanus]ETN73841.1 hypothetical protein NECAME_04233 [Necator americanus]
MNELIMNRCDCGGVVVAFLLVPIIIKIREKKSISPDKVRYERVGWVDGWIWRRRRLEGRRGPPPPPPLPGYLQLPTRSMVRVNE